VWGNKYERFPLSAGLIESVIFFLVGVVFVLFGLVELVSQSVEVFVVEFLEILELLVDLLLLRLGLRHCRSASFSPPIWTSIPAEDQHVFVGFGHDGRSGG